MKPVCEICKETIHHEDNMAKVEVGTRNEGWAPGYTHSSSRGISVAHIECLNIEHDEQEPAKTAYWLMQRLDESEKE